MQMRRKVMSGHGVLVESLESRELFAVSVVSAAGVLTIRGDGAAHTLAIQDAYTSLDRQTQLVVDGASPRSFDSIRSFDIQMLGSANQSISVTLSDNYEGANKSFYIKTGSGRDSVSFSHVLGNNIRNSNLSLSIYTGKGNDQVTLGLQQISSSTVTANISAGGGDDVVKVLAGNRVASSTVTINANLGVGNNVFRNLIDWDGFDLLGASSRWQVQATASSGNDRLVALGSSGNSAATVQGVLDLGLQGGGGSDSLRVDLGQFVLQGGTLRVRELAGNGGNSGLTLAGEILKGATPGTVDAVLTGGDGNDRFTLNTVFDGSTRYASAAGILVDGGAGTNTASVLGNAKVTLRHIR